MNELIITLFLAGGFLFIFALGEFLFHVLKTPAEISRKFVHLSSGFLTLTFPLFLTIHWYVLALCFAFALILVVSQKFAFLKSINNVDRTTRGSYLFPAAVYTSYLVFSWQVDLIYFFLPMLILAISDPLAALIGKRWPRGRYRVGDEFKTMSGSGAFVFSALITAIILFVLVKEELSAMTILISVMVSIVACAAEAVSRKGWDNITIPYSVITAYFIIVRLI